LRKLFRFVSGKKIIIPLHPINPSNNTKMKKFAFVIAIVGAFAIISCGPSAEQKAAAEKAKADSAKAADSMKMAAQATAAKAKQDSIAKAQAMAAKSDSTKKDSGAMKK
jgi:hypothetical protein